MLRVAILVVLVAAGCATRQVPYRFRAPVVGGVRAAEPPQAAPPAANRSSAVALAAATAAPAGEPGLADALRGLVGRRDAESSHVAFALAALAEVGGALDDELRSVETGRDLVVFDRVEGGRPASLVGVVVSRRADGTIEFVYLARGVVRRGWLNPAQPEEKRRDDGTVLNTFVRHNDGGLPRSAPTLAGQLFAGLLRLDRLARP